jgi:hypothetical protein
MALERHLEGGHQHEAERGFLFGADARPLFALELRDHDSTDTLSKADLWYRAERSGSFS